MVVALGDVPRLETGSILVELGVEIRGVWVKIGVLIAIAVVLE